MPRACAPIIGQVINEVLDTVSCSESGGLAWQAMDTAVNATFGTAEFAMDVVGGGAGIAHWAIDNATCSLNHVSDMV